MMSCRISWNGLKLLGPTGSGKRRSGVRRATWTSIPVVAPNNRTVLLLDSANRSFNRKKMNRAGAHTRGHERSFPFNQSGRNSVGEAVDPEMDLSLVWFGVILAVAHAIPDPR